MPNNLFLGILDLTKTLIRILQEYWPLLLKGLGITLLLSLITVFFGAIIGFFICIFSMSKYKLIRFIGKTYIEIVRGIPLLFQLFVFYAIMPNSNAFLSVAVALVINSGAYVAEIFRAGIQAVDKGQNEAARSLGLNRVQTMVKVIIPQAIKNILPAIGNEYVTVIKETSLASTFYVGELMTVHKIIGNESYLYLETYLIIGVFYFISTFTLSKLINLFERKLKESD